jgi:hypothetical protein
LTLSNNPSFLTWPVQLISPSLSSTTFQNLPSTITLQILITLHKQFWMIIERLLFESPDPDHIFLCGVEWIAKFRRKVGYTRRLAGSLFGCYCPQKGTWWRWTKTNNLRSSQSNCKGNVLLTVHHSISAQWNQCDILFIHFIKN